MRAHTPQDGANSRRNSVNRSFRSSMGGPSIPRPQTSLRESRISTMRATTQPTYDFLTGAESGQASSHNRAPSRQSVMGADSLRASSRESSKENMAPPDAEEYETQRKKIEELKAELATMRYKMSSFEQEKEMATLQHETEMREARRKAEEDFKQRQAAESERSRIQRQYDAIHNEMTELREAATTDKSSLEGKARELGDEARLLKEQLDDLAAVKEESERLNQRKSNDLQSQITTLQRTVQEFEQEGQARESALQKLQQELSEKSSAVGELETEILRLKAQTGDANTIAVIRRELADQVQHIRNLEATNREQHTELKHLRQVHKAVEVVEEEKRSLQRRLEAAESLETELTEAKRQRQRLEDERLAWTAYLQGAGDGDLEFDSPEAVARALVEERLNSASLTEKLGTLQPEIAERDSIIQSLEQDKVNLNAQIEKAKKNGTALPVDKARARIERQRDLAVKEAEYLRAQLKNFDAEDETFEPEKVDLQKAERISQLEAMVESYKQENQSLQTELSTIDPTAQPPQPPVGSKRGRGDDVEDERLGELNRKRRKLEDELSKVQKSHKLVEKELSVTRERLVAAETQAKTRILSLRSNPTSDFEAIKISTLAALKQENAELLAKLQKRATSAPDIPVIPASQLAAAKREIEEAKVETASAQKSARRLKEVWASKSAEFKEAIFSTLGWTVTFIPNGKMRVDSVFYPSQTDENENSIVFDGERGTMKVGGGPKSAFARRIGDQIQFWVREKGCIPGFLAALTLEFYEEHTRVSRP